MARLLSFPINPGIVSITPLTGPNARNSGANTASDGSEQTFSGVGDVVALQLVFNPKQRQGARRERGLFLGLHGGANATRFTFHDPDIMLPAEAGLVGAFTGQTWSNGMTWSNGKPWAPSYPTVAVSAAAAYKSGIVTLADEFWGHGLGMGDALGFFPFSLGIYWVTEVIDEGQYRLWPRLRTALTTSHRATLFPTLAMKPAGADAASMRRGVVHTESQSITLVEVIDPYVRSGFTD